MSISSFLICGKRLTLSHIQQICSRRLWKHNRVENMVTKGEIACFEQFLFLSPCFQKAVCCRGIRKPLYEGKGLTLCCWIFWGPTTYGLESKKRFKTWNVIIKFNHYLHKINQQQTPLKWSSPKYRKSRWCSGGAYGSVAGSIPGRVIPKTLKMVVVAALL